MPPFRPTPVGKVQDMETYAIKSPLRTHYRPARCEEVDCEHHRTGWDTIVNEATDLGQQQAGYIRRECDRIGTEGTAAHLLGRRRYTERQHVNELGGTVTVFHFPAGQQCFADHQVPVGRPELYLRRSGDWRGEPDRHARRTYQRPDQWVDDFASHQQALADLQQKG